MDRRTDAASPAVVAAPSPTGHPGFGEALSSPPQPSVTLRYTRTARGTRVAALFYSLIESAKLARAYLGDATRRAIPNPGTGTLTRDLK